MRECLVEVGLWAVDRLSFAGFNYGCTVKERVCLVENCLWIDFDAHSSCPAWISFPHLLELAHRLFLGQLDAVLGIDKLIVKLILEHRVRLVTSLQFSLQLAIPVHQLVVLLQGYLHLILSPLQSRSQLLDNLICFYELVRFLQFILLVFRLNVRLFKLKTVDAHFSIYELLL